MLHFELCVNLTGWKSHCNAQYDCATHLLRVVASLSVVGVNPDQACNPQKAGTLPTIHYSPQTIEILSVDTLMSRAAEMRRPLRPRLPSLWRETDALREAEKTWFKHYFGDQQCFRRPSIRHSDSSITNRCIQSRPCSSRQAYGSEDTEVRRMGRESLMQEMRLEDEKKLRCSK